jgi:hypothetical protein
LFNNGKETKRESGFMSVDDLNKFVVLWLKRETCKSPLIFII